VELPDPGLANEWAAYRTWSELDGWIATAAEQFAVYRKTVKDITSRRRRQESEMLSLRRHLQFVAADVAGVRAGIVTGRAMLLLFGEADD
jgi:hypothetical protein